MAFTLNTAAQSSFLRHQTLNRHPTHHQHPSSSLKFLSNPTNPSSLLVKPSLLKPSFLNPTTPSQPSTTIRCASTTTTTVWGHSLISIPTWAPPGPPSPPSFPPSPPPLQPGGRGDWRAWSNRNAGSKKKTNRLVVTLECTKCNKNRYTTSKNRFLTSKIGYGSIKQKVQKNKTESLQLNKHCPKCNQHTPHKEIKK